jgi:L-amino acid N-acyltransferase YncA
MVKGMESIQIREFVPGDFPKIADIYLQGIATGQATFQTQGKDWPEWDASYLQDCRLVATRGDKLQGDTLGSDKLLGWAALSSVSSRAVYSGVAEVSIYLDAGARGQGIGHRLLEALIQASEEAGLWTLQAGIFPENSASVALHHKNGFRTVGLREKLGQLHGVWRDVVLLERRSRKLA